MKKKIVIGCILILVLAAYAGRVLYLNLSPNLYDIETKRYGIDQKFELNDFEYTIKFCKLMDAAQLMSQYNVQIEKEEDVDSDKVKYLVGEMQVKYIGEEEKVQGHQFEFLFQSGGWYNGQDLFLFGQMNPAGTDFQKGEERTVYMLSAVRKIQFSDREWNKIENRKFDMVLSTYPTEVIVKCD